MTAGVTAACLMAAAAFYGLPTEPRLNPLVVILEAEGGRRGECRLNRNGTEDCGPFQINTVEWPYIAKAWQLPGPQDARTLVRDHDCAGAYAAAAIVRRHLDDTGDWRLAVGHYHSRTPKHRERYLQRLLQAWHSRFTGN